MSCAARVTDMHACPMCDGPKPHVGGPILPPGCPTVLIGFLPAARLTDMATCAGPPDIITGPGSPTVLIGGMPAARMGDMTAHGGVILPPCCPTVIIGAAGGGGGGAAGGGGGGASPGAASSAGGGGGGAGAAAVGRALSASPASVESVSSDQAGPLSPAEEDEEPSWIGIRLEDFTGEAMPDQPFQVTLEGGQVLSGTTDHEGYARFDNIDPDQGDVAFTQIPEREELAEEEQDAQATQADDADAQGSDGPTQQADDGLDFEALTRRGP